MSEPENLEGIAIVGMSGRFPGARDLEEYWRNLREGRETISFFRDEELLAAGLDPEILQAPDYVRAGGVLEGIEEFDAAFFGFTAREAELLDPHHRLFLEQAWQALEHAGYDADRYPGSIGVFGGMGMGEYLVKNLRSNPDVLRAAGGLRLRIYNDKDFLASLTAYKLNLKGPSATVQTACSTSLVAASLACQSLTGYQCDMALAGGVCLSVPSKAGYFAHEGVFSPDGHCRAFDAGAQGTVSGAGAGILLLKRLADAVADGDTIHAVIKGWAMNNDGSLKVGYTAPSLEGQAEVIAMAQAVAGVDPGTVSYIEAHGTGTPLGDQIEVAALTQVFRESTDRTGFCAIGSVKTNIGHLDAAAGAAALIKTALALRHREIPPSLNFRSPNPAIDFAAGPFYVNAERRAWESDGGPRRAGVSAFAVGGVNAHLVVEEAPPAGESGPGRPWQLLVLSARTPAALEAATDRLADFLERERPDLADAAFTLQAGRRAFPHRRALACRDLDDAVTALRGRDPRRLLTGAQESKGRPVAFLFPGLGNHYVGMARGLYEAEEVFRRHLDECAELLRPALGLDFRTVLFPENAAPEGNASGPDLRRMLRRGAEPEEGAGELVHTRLAQPVLFAVEYALARLWMAWGVRPRALAGYSLGEYVAACLAGVFTLKDALALVAERARLIDGLPAGAMLAVPLAEEEARRLLGADLSLAAVTGPEVSVVAGPVPAVEELERRLTARGISCRRLETTHAFHSSMMDPIVERFAERVRAVPRSAPSIPFVSNVTGSWITAEQAADPRYWAEHLRRPVRFADTLRELWREPGRALLEVGPGQALSAWALQLPAEPGEEAAPRVALPTLRHAYDPQPDLAFLLSTVGRLWLAGVDVPGEGFWAGQRRRRVPLPSYPFERRRYWVEPRRESFTPAPQPAESLARAPLADWFWTPVWREAAPAAAAVDSDGPWLLLLDGDSSFGLRLAERLEERGDEVVLAVAGERFERAAPGAYAVDPADAEGLSRLLAELREQGLAPARVVHLWSAGLPGLIALAQALGGSRAEGGIDLAVIAGRAWAVTGEEELSPAAAALLAACPVVALETPGVTCRAIDLPFPAPGGHRERDLIERLLAELDSAPTGDAVAFRGGRRWSRGFEPLRLGHAAAPRRGGVWMIVGGAGGIGGVLARELARSCRAKLVLVGRSAAAPPAGLEELGAEVLVVAADVTDREAMRRARTAAEERFGAVHGVIHAAGVPPGGMIQLKTREALDRVLAPKIEGVRVLEEVFADADLDALIVFSSLTATLGAFGLVDHAAANAWLDAWAHDAARRGLPALAIDWDAWLEVGQAAAAAAGHGVASAVANTGPNAGHPLLGARVESGPDRSAWSARLSPRTHWALDEHRIAGRGLLPGTAYLEMARAAGAELFGGGAVELRQVVFAAPLIVGDGEERETRTVAERAGEAWDLRISSRAGNGDWTEHARARLRPHSAAEPAWADLDRLRAACQGGAGALPAGERERGIGFGPRWRDLLRGLDAGPDQALARLELPAEFAADLDRHPLHPALLDAATGFVQLRGEGTYLPLGYERIVVHGGLPARVWSHARFAGGDGDTIACDLTLLDERGAARLEIEGYTLRRIADPAALAAAAGETPSAAERAPVLDGIRPDEGAEAFRRLLAAGLLPPQVLVSTRPFPAVLRQARSRSRERLLEEAEKIHASGGAVHARPDLPTPFVAPRTEMETRLAGLWRELLGLEAVGVHDDFFDLGGDSLLATRLIGTLDEVFGAQLSLRAVFEAPTVADLAVVLVQAQAAGVEETDLAAVLAEIQQLSPDELRRVLEAEGANR